MSLKSYKKNYFSSNEKVQEIKLKVKDEKLSIWTTVGESYGFLQSLVDNYKVANFFIPALLILTGIFFIGKHFWADIQGWALEKSGFADQGTTVAVSDNFLNLAEYISNPSGISKIAVQAFEQNILQEDTVSNNYQGIFYITIPSIGINRLPVRANIDSTNESVYNSVLKNSLAHFENTGLPISDIKNNIVIYGHSATANYNPKPNDPEVAFSFLSKLKVGDEISIEMDGNIYRFKMYRSKVVEPTDLSIINGQSNQRTLTLFTCHPAGNNSQRYVAIARPI